MTHEDEEAEKQSLGSANTKLSADFKNKQILLEGLQSSLAAKEQQADELFQIFNELKYKAADDKGAMLEMTERRDQLKTQIVIERENGKQQLKRAKEEMEKEI